MTLPALGELLIHRAGGTWERMLNTKRRAPDRKAEPRAQSRELAPWGGEEVDVDRFYAESWIDLLNRQRWLSKKLKLETAPWQVEITRAVKPADNVLEIDVVNLWPNRLIGDAALPPEKRFTRTNIPLKKNAR